jgi:osmotically-inducible protein OsmY
MDHAVMELMTTAISRINGDLRVVVADRMVQLSGQVNSWHEKQLAQESLRSVCSSYRIRNDIRVTSWN